MSPRDIKTRKGLVENKGLDNKKHQKIRGDINSMFQSIYVYARSCSAEDVDIKRITESEARIVELILIANRKQSLKIVID